MLSNYFEDELKPLQTNVSLNLPLDQSTRVSKRIDLGLPNLLSEPANDPTNEIKLTGAVIESWLNKVLLIDQ